MKRMGSSSIWECFIPELAEGQEYKYCFFTSNGNTLLKLDPYGVQTSAQPNNDSITCRLDSFSWTDAEWMRQRSLQSRHRPINIYQLHAGSWRRGEGNHFLRYEELAQQLPEYLRDMGYQYLELMPVMEYTFDGAWGYRTTGYFSPTFRYGTPQGLMQLIDRCHSMGIGVIMDWNIAHFPKDSHGLIELDGDCCYEYSDPLKRCLLYTSWEMSAGFAPLHKSIRPAMLRPHQGIPGSW